MRSDFAKTERKLKIGFGSRSASNLVLSRAGGNDRLFRLQCVCLNASLSQDNREAADAILKSGFRDGSGNYLTETVHTGVWLSDEPLDVNEGASGDVLLQVNIPPALETEVLACGWVEEFKSYREFLVPAALLRSAQITVVDEDNRDFEIQ
jgi:hypothetical protein